MALRIPPPRPKRSNDSPDEPFICDVSFPRQKAASQRPIRKKKRMLPNIAALFLVAAVLTYTTASAFADDATSSASSSVADAASAGTVSDRAGTPSASSSASVTPAEIVATDSTPTSGDISTPFLGATYTIFPASSTDASASSTDGVVTPSGDSVTSASSSLVFDTQASTTAEIPADVSSSDATLTDNAATPADSSDSSTLPVFSGTAATSSEESASTTTDASIGGGDQSSIASSTIDLLDASGSTASGATDISVSQSGNVSSTDQSATTTADNIVATTIVIAKNPSQAVSSTLTSTTTTADTTIQAIAAATTTTAETTSTATADTAMSADEIRAQVRAELEKEMSAAYASELQTAVAQAQDKLNATEQADMDAMRGELTSQIKQRLQTGCLTFDDGSYFCVNSGSASGTYAAPAPYTNVYSAKDASGNAQIFTQDGGRVMQITHSSYDNILPVWNKDKTLIAWQGLVNDRWQIFVDNLATGATQELAGGAANNINPTIDGARVAWQGWDSNWEIYLAEQSSTGWQAKEITN
ncbi:MAG TPA: hypothetical protein VNG29_02485, partial [Candidatus Paceibacterota bacterium]|nr:hypothetical protein [Candidatus Paceibacterota bacterium]